MLRVKHTSSLGAVVAIVRQLICIDGDVVQYGLLDALGGGLLVWLWAVVAKKKSAKKLEGAL